MSRKASVRAFQLEAVAQLLGERIDEAALHPIKGLVNPAGDLPGGQARLL